MLWTSDFRKPNPPVTDQLVREVEGLLGVDLPASYVALMREKNGGYIGEQLVGVDAELPAGMEHYVDDGFVSMGSINGIHSDPDAANGLMITPYMIGEWNLPEGLVLLDGDGHTWVALDYRQRAIDPPVVFIDSGSREHIAIAANFAELLAKMVPYEDLYDEDGGLRER